MPLQKIDHGQLVTDLVSTIKEIESSGSEQKVKTRKIKAAATKYLNGLHKDARKFKGKEGEKRRIATSTARRYISTAREQIENLGLIHHLFSRDLDRLKSKYPEYASMLSELSGLDFLSTRLKKQSMVSELIDSSKLIHQIEAVDAQSKEGKRTLDQLASRYPLYAGAITNLRNEYSPENILSLERMARNREDLAEALSKLKTDHEVLSHLHLDQTDHIELETDRVNNLSRRKSGTIAINYKNYIARVGQILANPVLSSAETGMKAIAPLTFALAAVTGRRPIEILITGDFSAAENNKLSFSGQAKKRFDEQREETHWIYSLVDTKTVLTAFAYLRSMPVVQSLTESMPGKDDYRSLNKLVNDKTSKVLNEFAKDFFNDKKRIFKDTRGTWARIAYELHFTTDAYWKDKDDDTFYSEQLIHDAMETQLHYKPYKVKNLNAEYEPDLEPHPDPRIGRLTELDSIIPPLGNGSSAENLHEKVKKYISENPGKPITQNLLTLPPFSSFRGLVKKYLEATAEALGIEWTGKQWAPKKPDLPPILEQEDQKNNETDNTINPEPYSDSEQEAPAPEPAKEPKHEPQAKPSRSEPKAEAPSTTKPHYTAVQTGDLWMGMVIVDNEPVHTSPGHQSKMTAQIAAGKEYAAQQAPKPEMHSGKTKSGQWLAQVTVNGQVVGEAMGRGKESAVKEAAWKDYEAAQAEK